MIVTNIGSKNIVTTSTTLIEKVSSSPFIVHNEKLKMFNDLNWKWQQQKILFYLTILNLTMFFTRDASKQSYDKYNPPIIVVMDA